MAQDSERQWVFGAGDARPNRKRRQNLIGRQWTVMAHARQVLEGPAVQDPPQPGNKSMKAIHQLHDVFRWRRSAADAVWR
jgi:hypothetical protein